MFPGWRDPFANDRSTQRLRQGLSRTAAPYAQQLGQTIGRVVHPSPWKTTQNRPSPHPMQAILRMLFPGGMTGGSYGTRGRR